MAVFHKAYTGRVGCALVLLAILTVTFWMTSRYPDLDDKALMGGAIVLEDPLSFEALIPVTADQPVVHRIAFTTLNWFDTNRNGMTFGVLLGAVFLTLLGYINRRSLSGALPNTVLGTAIGMPLGVCVNCAAPIASGLYNGGARAETTLAAMIASPTLNIVVLTMLFSLFPFYMALTKLLLSIAFIMVVVPAVVRLLPPSQLVAASPIPPPCPIDDLHTNEPRGQVLGHFTRDYLHNLWRIVRLTVPLMLLAGFLGAVLATLAPMDLLSERPFAVFGAIAVAVLGVIAPVPIGFDVVFSGALLNGGADQGYVMILLFSLGIFSIYSFMVVMRTISTRAAVLLGAAVVLVSLAAGSAVHYYHAHQLDSAIELLTSSEAPTDDAPSSIRKRPPPTAEATSRLPRAFEVSIERTPFNTPVESPTDTAGFVRMEAWQIGVDIPVEFSMVDMWPPFWEGRSIASGDIDKDGDVDLVIASTRRGLYRFDNDGSGAFSRQSIATGGIEDMPVFNAVLVDVDNDGWLDLFVSTYHAGNYWIRNDQGKFEFSGAAPVANRSDAVLSLALSFADVDRNGFLDVALGNWAAGWYRRIPGDESRNRVIYNDGDLSGQRFTELPGIPGETLSILFSDVNLDGRVDLLVGNDFEIPDYFYFGGEDGFEPVTHGDGIVPHTTTTTMSLKTADLWNDRRVSIYAAQIAGRSSNVSERLDMQPIEKYCDNIVRDVDRATCRQNMAIKRWYRSGHSFDPGYASRCQEMTGRYASECRGMLIKDLAIQRNDPDVCALIPGDQVIPRQYCDVHFRPVRTPTEQEARDSIQQILAHNVLLVPTAPAQFEDQATAAGLEVGGWSWDTKIGDFDNDGWQDVYIVNGTWVPNEVTPSNLFFRNQGDGTFEEATREFGLVDHLITAAATRFDIDTDGDPDVVAMTVNGPPVAFVNHANQGNAIQFQVRDDLGNHYGIGTRIEIRYGTGGSHRQMREIQLGGGFMSFDAPIAHFGLGDETRIQEVLVRWSDGDESRIGGPFDTGAQYTLVRRPAAR